MTDVDRLTFIEEQYLTLEGQLEIKRAATHLEHVTGTSGLTPLDTALSVYRSGTPIVGTSSLQYRSTILLRSADELVYEVVHTAVTHLDGAITHHWETHLALGVCCGHVVRAWVGDRASHDHAVRAHATHSKSGRLPTEVHRCGKEPAPTTPRLRGALDH